MTEAHKVDATLRALLADVLGLGAERAAALTEDSGLFGELPEFDSMAVATVLTEMEDRLGILIDDDDVDGEIFESSATFNVVRFDSEFIVGADAVKLGNATCAMTGDEISLVDAVVDGTLHDLILKWRTAEQGFEIIEIR